MDDLASESGTGQQEAASARAEEAVLNAAVAFAGHVATAAQQATAQATGTMPAPLQAAMYRQYLLETATLCLRRLADAYATAAADPDQAAVQELLVSGAEQARQISAQVETLGDLSLDLFDRLVEE